jgi:uncharacterized protein DUF3386
MNLTVRRPRLGPCFLALGLATLLPGAASAHFVWTEPAPTPGDAVRVYFGEYPDVRENSPLLDKVARVKVYAVDGKGRRELKQSRREDHFLYEGLGRSPVAVALLDYGVLQRGEGPPYLLRYEAQVLLGDGTPQPAQGLAALSRQETGLPLAVHLQAVGEESLSLRVTLEGKPGPAEIAFRGPKDREMRKEKTSPAGLLALPLTDGGWHHVRIMAEDGKPTQFEGKEARFTRTYLSLMFNAAGRQPAASAGKAVQPDADAVQVLREAHAARANWGPDFPGFTADAVYRVNGKEARGTITVARDYTITYALGDKEAEGSLRPSFASLIMHRRRGSPEYQATWRDSEAHPLGRAINLNDELNSFYRVRDRQILQVNRVMGSQRFTNNVLENERTKLGFLPRAWTVAYYDREGNTLQRVSTTQVTWTWIGDVFLPATLQTVNAHAEGTDVSQLVLTNHRLLKR